MSTSHLSLFLGPNVSGPAEDRTAIDLCIEQALMADDAGFAAIYVGEQHFNDYEPYSNPIVTAAYLAGRLQQAYLGTSMIPLPQHHPLSLVERINLLDQLTRGRCVIGMSSGRPVPMPAFPTPRVPGGNAALFDAKLDVMLRAWAHRPGDGPLEFDTGAEQGVMDGRIMPFSYRTRPLFAVGTSTESKIRDAGLAGRMVHTAGLGVAGAARLAGLYRDALEEGGATTETIAHHLGWLIHTKTVFVGETDEAAATDAEPMLLNRSLPPWIHTPPEQESMGLAELLRTDPGPPAPRVGAPESLAAFMQRSAIVGSPETVASELAVYADAGLPHVHMRTVFGSLADLDPFRRSMDLLIKEVVPRLDMAPMPAVDPADIRPEFRS